MLENKELADLVTALGCGVGKSFDLGRMRYGKVILLADADSDGHHISTLLLTFLFRYMRPLVESGHVYIAKPPLYKFKSGKQQRYIEKDSELEEILLSDKLEKIEVTDRQGASTHLTEARWQKLSRLLKTYDGWGGALRANFGRDTVQFLDQAGVFEYGMADAESLIKQLAADSEERPFEVTLEGQDPVELRVKVIERKSGTARVHHLRRSLFESQEYRELLKVHEQLVGLLGTGPFTVALDTHFEEADIFADVRTAVLKLAQRGVDVQRFKGLGEMNPEQLRETTMDPANRTLAQVTIDDAAEADKIFSTLMGDQVEGRRKFIEDNAQQVVNLDV